MKYHVEFTAKVKMTTVVEADPSKTPGGALQSFIEKQIRDSLAEDENVESVEGVSLSNVKQKDDTFELGAVKAEETETEDAEGDSGSAEDTSDEVGGEVPEGDGEES